jgi:hypothetical protein
MWNQQQPDSGSQRTLGFSCEIGGVAQVLEVDSRV